MKDRLLVSVLGHRNSGKSTSWSILFDSTVRTGKKTRWLYLNRAQSVEVFLMSGSPQERGLDPRKILPKKLPKIVLCSMQYHHATREDFGHFMDLGYDIFVQWLNPGYADAAMYSDDAFLMKWLTETGATAQIRNGQTDPKSRISEIRQYILGWATYRNLLHTDFPR